MSRGLNKLLFCELKEVKEMLSEKIKILSSEEAELLTADKLPKKHRNSSGLYLTCEDGHYIAYDYSERQSWSDFFESTESAPEGFSKEFSSPLDAINWLLR